jgi:hypothetical protein
VSSDGNSGKATAAISSADTPGKSLGASGGGKAAAIAAVSSAFF